MEDYRLNTGNATSPTKVELAVSDDRRHTVRSLAEITGCVESTVHRTLKWHLLNGFRVYYRKMRLQRVSDTRTFTMT